MAIWEKQNSFCHGNLTHLNTFLETMDYRLFIAYSSNYKEIIITKIILRNRSVMKIQMFFLAFLSPISGSNRLFVQNQA